MRAAETAAKREEKKMLEAEDKAATAAYAAEVRKKKNKGADPLKPKVRFFKAFD